MPEISEDWVRPIVAAAGVYAAVALVDALSGLAATAMCIAAVVGGAYWLRQRAGQ